MKILIVSATDMEIRPVLNYLGVTAAISHGKIKKYKHKKLEIDILITGVGMVAMAYYTGKKLNRSYDFALNAGICGSFNTNLKIGAVVNVAEDCFSELGAEDEDRFLTLNELNLQGITTVSNFNLSIDSEIMALLPKVNGITVNTVHGNDITIEKVVQKFHPVVESMEGAAFLFSCKEEGVPSIQIRAVSNYVEKRNRENWNIPLAIKNLNEKIIEILNSF